jgi:uncharacterized coiled-coil protein SlyX
MQLPDFIKRALTFFEKAEANLTAEQQLSQAQTKVAELEGQATKDKGAIEALNATIKDLQGKLETAQNEVNAKGTEIKTCRRKSKRKRSARTKPSPPRDCRPAELLPQIRPQRRERALKSLIDQMNAITNPRDKSAFIQKHYAALFGAAQQGLRGPAVTDN